MSWVHDNEISSYEVDLRNERIILHTLYENKNKIEHTDVIFDGVLCHMFEHHLHGSIILDIKDYDIQLFIKDNSEQLTKDKDFGWPMIYANTAELAEKLTQAQYKYIVIMSSYGLNGWVLAKEYKIQVHRSEEVNEKKE